MAQFSTSLFEVVELGWRHGSVEPSAYRAVHKQPVAEEDGVPAGEGKGGGVAGRVGVSNSRRDQFEIALDSSVYSCPHSCVKEPVQVIKLVQGAVDRSTTDFS